MLESATYFYLFIFFFYATMFMDRMATFEFLLGPLAILYWMNLRHIALFKILISGVSPYFVLHHDVPWTFT
jgi:hypothetical protein